MKHTFSRSLSKKKVMTEDGTVIGTIRNVMIDLDTGQVDSLVVRPDSGFDTTGYTVDGDRLMLPFEAVRNITDYIVVDRYLSKM
ncbi:MAG: PRC-barrel domain-containing protein [Methanomicrobium sp.]|nr:PRC-barrel domain-containing protein [Methanomicrobium sp.]